MIIDRPFVSSAFCANSRAILAAADAGADGVIVGSRLVRAAAEAAEPAAAVRELVGRFADALR